MALAMRDARSPFLESGRKAIEAFLEQAKDSPAAAAIGMLLADSQLRPFHRIETPKGKTSNVIRQSVKPDPKKALQMTEPALKMLGGDSSRSANLPHHRVVRLRAACLKELDQVPQAKKEITALRGALQKRGVKASVLQQVQDFEKAI
jgi:hypothetical protein